MTKHNPENERIKRRYFTYLKEARRHSESTVDAVAKALNRWEEYIRHRDFKAFHYEQAVAFKNRLIEEKSVRSGERLSKAMRAKRDYAMLALLVGCGFRRSELVGLELDEIQIRQGHWAVVDLIGKGGHIRTVPIPNWAKAALDQWTAAAGVSEGRIFRAVARTGKVWGEGISQNVVWYVVKTCCERVGLDHIAPHDLRRTCAKLCNDGGGELEQIQFLLGHVSVQTTERYLGCKQNLGSPVNDRFKLRTDVPSVVVKGAIPAETVSREGIECRHGGSDHDQPNAPCDPERVSETGKFAMVEVGKDDRPQSLRRCTEAGASRRDAGSTGDGQSDRGALGTVGPGTPS